MKFMPEGLERLGPQNYGEYLKHQVSKLALVKDWIVGCEPRYRMELRGRLQESGLVSPGMSVLCLGAQLGGEVRAFIDCGCFAVGLDLNPGEANRFVVHGDFHQIQFATGSVDIVFTNSVDHVFNLRIFIEEICRVLKPNGFLVMEVINGRADGVQPGDYESLFWQRADDILAPFLAGPFNLITKQDIEWPWVGQYVVLKRKERLNSGQTIEGVIARASMIPGRCLMPELVWLYQLAFMAPLGLPMVELGTFQGRTAAILCAAAKQIGSEVITIDNYVQDPTFANPYIRHLGDPDCGKSPEEYAHLTRENLAKSGLEARVVIGDSATVPEGIEEIGLLFIDSEHNGERFNAECDAWLPLMPRGGILACHDYQQPSWPAMTPVIDERIKSHTDEWEYLGLALWLIGFKKR